MRRDELAVTPESEALSQLKAEVDALIDEATALESEFSDVDDRLNRFRADYVTRVAPVIARVEFLEAEVARTRGAITDELVSRAEEAARVASEEPPVLAGQPVTNDGWKARMKDRHRALVRRLHPDLAVGDEDRERRTALLARLNEAWAVGDEATIARLEAQASELGDSSVSLNERMAALVHSRAALRERIRVLRGQLEVLLGSRLELLRQQTDEAQARGQDLLASLVAELELRAELLEAELLESVL